MSRAVAREEPFITATSRRTSKPSAGLGCPTGTRSGITDSTAPSISLVNNARKKKKKKSRGIYWNAQLITQNLRNMNQPTLSTACKLSASSHKLEQTAQRLQFERHVRLKFIIQSQLSKVKSTALFCLFSYIALGTLADGTGVVSSLDKHTLKTSHKLSQEEEKHRWIRSVRRGNTRPTETKQPGGLSSLSRDLEELRPHLCATLAITL